jgi:Putative zinc-finger
MDHQDVKNAKLVERYLLGELADPERDAFEEHYFSCPVCAEEVVTATKFLDNAKRPLMELQPGQTARPVIEAAAPWWERWLAFAPKPALAGACTLLAATVVWQGSTAGVPPEVTGSYFVTATRAAGGAPRKIQVVPEQKRVALLFNYTDTTVTQFTFLLENTDGQAVQQFNGRAPQDTNDIQVLVPVKGLHSGRYTLRVQDSATQREIAALPFELALP